MSYASALHTITGTLVAIVVNDGDSLLSDRDHCIKAQLPCGSAVLAPARRWAGRAATTARPLTAMRGPGCA